MKATLYLENFKGFERAEFEMAPITLLIGANSTGKSSIIKALKILANQREFFETDLRQNTNEGLIKLEIIKRSGKEDGAEQFEVVLPPPPERAFYPSELVYHLSSIRYELPREITSFREFSTRLGKHGENLYEVIIADALKAFASGGHKFPVIERINEFLKNVNAGFFYSPEVKMVSSPTELPRFKFSIEVIDKGVKVNLLDAGFGYTQFLYVASFILLAGEDIPEGPKGLVFVLLEEPAIHLNPKLVVELLDVIIEQTSPNKLVIIETHSEHILMRLRRRIAEGRIKPSDAVIYFFEKEKDITTANKVDIDEHGELSQNFPTDFLSQEFVDLMARVEAARKKHGDDSN